MKKHRHGCDMKAEFWKEGKKGPTATCTCGAEFTVEGDTIVEIRAAFQLLLDHVKEEESIDVLPR